MKKLLFITALLVSLSISAEERVKINDSEQENYVTLPETSVIVDNDGCIQFPVLLDKEEEREVSIIITYSGANGSFIYPMTMPAGKTKGTLKLCSEQVGGKFEAGQTYTLEIRRIRLR